MSDEERLRHSVYLEDSREKGEPFDSENHPRILQLRALDCPLEIMEKLKKIYQKEYELGHDLLSRNRRALDTENDIKSLGTLVDFVLADQEARENFTEPDTQTKELLKLAEQFYKTQPDKGDHYKRILEMLDPESVNFNPVYAKRQLLDLYNEVNDLERRKGLIYSLVDQKIGLVSDLKDGDIPDFSYDGILTFNNPNLHGVSAVSVYLDVGGEITFKERDRRLAPFSHLYPFKHGVGGRYDKKNKWILIDEYGALLHDERFSAIKEILPKEIHVTDSNGVDIVLLRDDEGKILPGRYGAIYDDKWHFDFKSSPFAKTSVIATKPNENEKGVYYIFNRATGGEVAGPYKNFKFTHTSLNARETEKGWQLFFDNKGGDGTFRNIKFNKSGTIFSGQKGGKWFLYNEEGEKIQENGVDGVEISQTKRQVVVTHNKKPKKGGPYAIVDGQTGETVGDETYLSVDTKDASHSIRNVLDLDEKNHLLDLDSGKYVEGFSTHYTDRNDFVRGHVVYYTDTRTGKRIGLNLQTKELKNARERFHECFITVGENNGKIVVVTKSGEILGEYSKVLRLRNYLICTGEVGGKTKQQIVYHYQKTSNWFDKIVLAEVDEETERGKKLRLLGYNEGSDKPEYLEGGK